MLYRYDCAGDEEIEEIVRLPCKCIFGYTFVVSPSRVTVYWERLSFNTRQPSLKGQVVFSSFNCPTRPRLIMSAKTEWC